MSNADRRIINSPDQAPAWDQWATNVRKIVLGPSPGASEAKPLSLGALPADLAERFPELTHLYLWQIEGLQALPVLPPKLECLDVRGCAELTGLPELPATLGTLVLEKCARLQDIPGPGEATLRKLTDLSLKGCVSVSEAWIHAALKAAPALRYFDASECPQLVRFLAWPVGLERIEINGCPGLKALPARWPGKLRRLGLRGAEALSRLPDFPGTLDYVDLAFTKALRSLPVQWGQPRTMFLHGSGVLMPPASEHGKDANQNVAARTRAYFDDVALAGPGEVKRCKLLLLGNGSAGKTSLALRLVPGKDPGTDNPGTTHGVQFWDWDFEADVGGSMEPVHLHLWDFGGQEIYHNTHRLFMSKGAVFVLLWRPEQDGEQPLKSDSGYQDEWRPLQYWLDLIHLACPHRPRIAIVCSHHSAKTTRLERQWRDQVTANHRDLRCFYIDSVSGEGEVAGLEEWLRDEVGEVVQTQGVVVPSYWEIAQDLVESWLPKPQPGTVEPAPAQHNEMRPDRFREELHEAMQKAIRADREGKYARLAAAMSDGRFALNDDRIRRALGFLTHSGWVYWDEELFEGRVIIGQQWALQGIYTVLDRRPKSFIYRELRRADGQFTRQNLDEWIWHELYAEHEQRLLISFMKAVGLCFELVAEQDSRWQEAVFKSFEHLPVSKELSLQTRFDQSPAPISRTLACPRLHKGHWQALLKDLGEHYGTDAEYAADGFFLQNKEGQVIFITVRLAKAGLGGEITVQVAGPEAADRAEALSAHALRFLPETPGSLSVPGADSVTGGPAGSRTEKIHVFFSYAWDPERQPRPTNYEKPVAAICAALEDEPVELLRDKKVIQSGESIEAFMQRIKKADKVLIVHSDKYWRSAFCMYELWLVMESFKHRPTIMADVLILVEHTRSGFQDGKTMKGYRKAWEAVDTLPTLLEKTLTLDKFKSGVISTFDHHLPDLAALADRNVVWDEAQAAAVVAWVKKRIGLQPPASHPEARGGNLEVILADLGCEKYSG